MSEPVPIFVDDRAGSNQLIRYLPGCEVARMDFGDVMIIGNGPDDCPSPTIGIEVKSTNDLIQSINTGRLAGHQLPGLIEGYDIPYLLHYGDYRCGDGGALQVRNGQGWRSYRIGSRLVPYGYLEGFLLDVAALGVRIRREYSIESSADWIKYAHRWWSKRWSDHKGLRQFDRSRDLSLMPGMDARTAIRARVAAQLPGIGFDKACKVANHFPSIRDMINASIFEWMEVPGIGEGIATTVIDVIDG